MRLDPSRFYGGLVAATVKQFLFFFFFQSTKQFLAAPTHAMRTESTQTYLTKACTELLSYLTEVNG